MFGGRKDPYFYFGRLRPQLEQIRSDLGLSSEDDFDVKQEVALRYSKSFKSIDSPEGWVLVAYRREGLRFLQKRKASGERNYSYLLIRDGEVDAGEPLADTRQESLFAAIDRLSAKDQVLIQGHYIEGLSLAQLAEKRGVKAGSMKNLLLRARERLREAVASILGPT